MTNNRFRKQFLLTKQTSFDFAWNKLIFQEFTLFCHPELELTVSKSDEKELFMLGSMYDWETPEQTNQQLLDTLVRTSLFENFLAGLSKYSGQYIILYSDKNNIFLLNDACAQHEIYYDTSFTTFGSQPKLIGEVIEMIPHNSQDAKDFYSSRAFLSRKLFVGDSTHVGNIKHLLPNHYIDIKNKAVVRYFPSVPTSQLSSKEVAPKACQMLKGYIKAVAKREKIAMAVTGGYDSRVLFLASLDEDCKYFVSQHKNMDAKHYDITVPQRLTKMHGKEFEVIPDAETFEDVSDSIDFPRALPKAGKCFENHIYLNGNISELARNYNGFGFGKKVTAEDLSFISGYYNFSFVVGLYRQWLENADLFRTNGYDTLHMYYWEAKNLGVYAAKEKTMMRAIGREVFSPFGSRDLLVLLLSTPQKDRDYCFNKLYNMIMLELSPDALKVPINPCLKKNMIRLMKRLRIYNMYRYLGLKYRFLKF